MAGDGNHRLLIALNGMRAKRTGREIAALIHGAEETAAEWDAGDWMKLRTKRLRRKAKLFLKARKDYRAMAALPG